jgi:hypothetical protein
VKSSKEPSKEHSLPSQDETRRANVLREEMLSQFRTLGEAFSLLRDDVHNMKPKLDKIDKLDEHVETLNSAVRSQAETLRSHSEDLRAIKSDVAEIKSDLKNYSQRLEVVEVKLAS